MGKQVTPERTASLDRAVDLADRSAKFRFS